MEEIKITKKKGIRNKKLLLGYLGFINNQIDGQTVKTRLVKEILESEYKDFIYLDTQKLKYNKLFLFQIIKEAFKADKIIIMPGQNGLKIIFPIIYIISKFLNKDIFYIVVGGWLVDFIENKSILKNMLKNISGIYIEIPELVKKLQKLGFTNTKVLYNFRKIDIMNTNIIQNDKKELKLVFYSRVIKEKGILDLIEVINNLDENISLDIYGPIDIRFKNEFENRIISKRIEYKGVLSSNQNKILSSYNLMVFPTYYEGEGFAGVIIESYMAGLPILGSDWKYNKDFIIDNKTGKLYESRNLEDLRNKILYFYNNKHILLDMKSNIKIELEKYDYRSATRFVMKSYDMLKVA